MSWQLTSFLILGGALAVGFAWYERSRPPARVLALVAALAALAVVGRLAFAPLPNVKPTTDIVLFAGYALGGAPGFAVGAVTALVSNVFLLHGPWTPWQMAAWGGVGIAGAALGARVRRRGRRRARSGVSAAAEPRELGRWPLALACGAAGLAFGVVMDLHLWSLAAEQTLAGYLAISARSLPFNVAHAVGNVVFCLLIGPPFVRALRRYRRRLEVRWAGSPESAGASNWATAGAVALLAGVAVAAGAPPARADQTAAGAARYLAGAQNRDGGLGSAPGQASSPYFSSWAALGLAAGGRNPRDVARPRRSLIDYLTRNAHSIDSTQDLERTILVARASGMDPRRFAGRNLRRELLQRRHGDGSFDGLVDRTAFGVMALRAAGDSAASPAVQRATRWLVECQNGDGGFGPACDRPSDVDDTGGVLQALRAAGRAGSPAAEDGLAYLEAAQTSEGGFGPWKGRSPNAQSTAYAVQGLVAAGRGGGRSVNRALAYLRSLRARDGSILQSEGASVTPVWVTGQALAALHKKTFPLQPVARRPQRSEGSQDRSSLKRQGDGDSRDGSSARRSAKSDRARRSRAGSGEGGTSGGGPGGGSGTAGGSATAGSTAGGASAAPAFGGSASASAEPPVPPGVDLPGAAAAALASRGVPLPGSLSYPLGAPGRLFSDASGVPLAPAASRTPAPPERGATGRRIGAGAALLALVALGIVLATGGGARARRLWAAGRLRS